MQITIGNETILCHAIESFRYDARFQQVIVRTVSGKEHFRPAKTADEAKALIKGVIDTMKQ